MASSLNKIMLIGNLGQDAETRFTTSNVGVTSFSLATNRRYKNKDGNWTDETQWHNIVAFNLFDTLKENLKKGRKVYVEGRLTYRDFEGKDGIKRKVTEIISDSIMILEAREHSGASDSSYEKDIVSSSSDQKDDLPF